MTQFFDALMHSIPVFLMLEPNTPVETTKSAFSDNAGGVFGAVMMLLVMLAVIVGAYFVTRWIASGTMRMQKGSKMRVVDRLALSRDKSIIVVEIGGYYYAVGVANNAVTLLCELPDGVYDGESASAQPRADASWKSVFQQNMNNPPKRREPRRRVDEDELTRMAERMRKRSESMNNNRENGHDED